MAPSRAEWSRPGAPVACAHGGRTRRVSLGGGRALCPGVTPGWGTFQPWSCVSSGTEASLFPGAWSEIRAPARGRRESRSRDRTFPATASCGVYTLRFLRWDRAAAALQCGAGTASRASKRVSAHSPRLPRDPTPRATPAAVSLHIR